MLYYIHETSLVLLSLNVTAVTSTRSLTSVVLFYSLFYRDNVLDKQRSLVLYAETTNPQVPCHVDLLTLTSVKSLINIITVNENNTASL